MRVGLTERAALKRQCPHECGRADAKDLFRCPSQDVKMFPLQEANGPMPGYVGSVSPPQRTFASAASKVLFSMTILQPSHMAISQECQARADRLWRMLRGQIFVLVYSVSPMYRSGADHILLGFLSAFGMCSTDQGCGRAGRSQRLGVAAVNRGLKFMRPCG